MPLQLSPVSRLLWLGTASFFAFNRMVHLDRIRSCLFPLLPTPLHTLFFLSVFSGIKIETDKSKTFNNSFILEA